MNLKNIIIAAAFLVFVLGMIMALIPTTRTIDPSPERAPAPSDPAMPAQSSAPAEPGNAPVRQ
ncbi:hypothetical protein J5J86_15090 [Aquabacter sp. L1I39]|uniref:DUF948 domain-containing protein n=1 Tax=Aquabacter sp. L1I39 TaxID=2820278 RepID=UPI001ADAF31A|nr:DUF948 domain-containing protein [Aquabacter sp. L1I39]QTL02123.1 hypothetical protein J5J86_15090 [Aquabacter sp. L1I39]